LSTLLDGNSAIDGENLPAEAARLAAAIPVFESAAVLSVERAAQWLDLPLDAATTWLRQHHLVHLIKSGPKGSSVVYERVIVHDVLEALRSRPAEAWVSTTEAAAILNIDRTTIDAMIDRAPKDLPGAPTQVGSGKLRNHYRWNPALLHEWARAYRDWKHARSRRR
jgi:hypothetical protein